MKDHDHNARDDRLRFLGTSVLPELDGKTVGVYQRVETGEYVVGSGERLDEDDPLRSRPDLRNMTPDALYVRERDAVTVRFLGTTRMKELHGEEVGVCKVVDADEYVILTQHGHRLGETVTPVGERLAEEVE